MCWRPILLVTVRIIQGLAFGAEWGGAILMSYEHAPWREKGKYTGMVQAGFPVGLLLANLVFLVSVHLGGDWAWRVPFLASIFLVIVGLIIRSRVPESPVFEDVKDRGDIVKSPIVAVVKTDWRNILRGIGLRIAETAGYAVSITYMISYLKNAGLATKTETLVALCIASGLGIFATMAWARLTDKVGRRPVYLWVCALGIPFGVIMFLLVNTGLLVLIIATFVLAYGCLPERVRRCPGRLVPGTVHGQHPRLGSLTGISDFGDGVRLHSVHHHAAFRGLRLDRPRPVVQHVCSNRLVGRVGNPRDVGPARAQARRRGCGRHRSGTRSSGVMRSQKVAQAAYRMRHHVLNMGEAQGQGYVGQALGAADMLAAVYADQLRYRADDPHWAGRDRFLLSTGHYAIGLYAALAEAGIVDVDELHTYGSDDSRLPMSGMASYTTGMEISGGSLGHGLTVAVGMALGLRLQGSGSRVINFLSDGELDEGSTWEAAMGASHHGLGNLIAMVDINALQADGPTVGVLRTEPVADKWAACGWHVQRVDGNDVDALLDAFDNVHSDPVGVPSVILCDTRIGCGVPMLERREKAHFMRIDADEWQICRDQLTAGHEGALV